MTRTATITFALHEAWETWAVNIPDGMNPDDLAFADVEFVSMIESGNSGMMIESVDVCNTCDGTGVHMTTTEDSPTTLVEVGPCEDCT